MSIFKIEINIKILIYIILAMHFCKVCQNMYYIRLKGEDSNNLIYYCRKCGNEDDTLGATLDNICVSKTQVRKKEGGVRHLVN